MSNKPNIFICGMHRSGTSLTGKFFENLGYHFGESKALLPPHKSNKEGFWERKDVLLLNEKILAMFGSSWDYPVHIPTELLKQIAEKNILNVTEDAKEVIKQLPPPFAIKDPRLSLTLPFWQEILPNHKIVIVVRNPIDVARSLSKRNHISLHLGLMLWQKYYQILLTQTQSSERFFLFQDALINSDEKFIKAILAYLNLDEIKYVKNAIKKSVNKTLLTHAVGTSPETVLKGRFHQEINKLWQAMRTESDNFNNSIASF
jgi:hypothetical protein